MDQWNFIAVVGEEEAKKGTIALREREASKDVGQFTIGDAIKYLRSLGIPESKEEANLKGNAFWGNHPEYKDWNEELSSKTFFEGEGFEIGKKDKEIFELIADNLIDNVSFPNLGRWHRHMHKLFPRPPKPEEPKKEK